MSFADVQINVDQIIQQYGPTVWEAAKAQVRVDVQISIYALVALAVLVVALVIGSIVCGIKWRHGDSYNDWSMLAIFAGLFAMLATAAWAIVAMHLYSLTQNPTWAAIQNLHTLVRTS